MNFSGYHVCFSGFSDNDDDDDDGDASDTALSALTGGGAIGRRWSLRAVRRLAESMGAVVQAHITRRTTVLVARRGLTRKRLVAEQHGIPVVSPRWLESHGRLLFADARVELLSGYTFCATQMTRDEEEALATIIEANGGEFDRTLTSRTSMLFVPPGWVRQRQQQMRLSGGRCEKLSTGPQGDAPSLVLPEKIRFAWATDIPVVEYTRFLSMVALGSEKSGADSRTAARADFDTIAQLCALPVSVVGGAVPHTQWGATPTCDGDTEKKGAERRKETLLESTDTGHMRKRRREGEDENAQEVYYHGAGGKRNQNNNKSSGDGDTRNEDSRRMKVQVVEGDAVQDDCQGSRGDETMQPLLHRGKEMPVAAQPRRDDEELNNSQTSGAGVIVPTSSSRACKAFSPSRQVSWGGGDVSCSVLFTHSYPFLQVALLGCSEREMMDCIRMTVICRFLRTPVVTPFTDIVVVGSEFGPDTFENASTFGAVRDPSKLLPRPQHEQHQYRLLARLREHLNVNYGVPMERIVNVEWLQSCYQRVMLRQTPAAGGGTCGLFAPSPLSLSDVPPPENFYLRPPSSISRLESPPQPTPQEEEKQPQRHLVPPLRRLRKRRTADNPPQQQQSEQQSISKPRDESGAPKAVGDVQKQYEAELHLADRRVRDLLSLMDPTTEVVDGLCSLFASCLFCFVDQEFSRIELAVVRALIKHGGGMWLKKTRDDWIRALTRTGALAAADKNHPQDSELMALVRRQSVLGKRLHRAPTEDAEGDEASTRCSMRFEGRQSCKTSSPTSSKQQTLVMSLYIVPHQDQRLTDGLLRSEGGRGAMQQRHPLRYLPAVTQDYILCCLAARRLLHPGSCFLFFRPLPSEAERLARRRRWCNEFGKSLTVSPWIGSRRHEKAPLIGVSTYFLCAMHDEADAAAIALRRVLLTCLAVAVSELGGHITETLLQEAVTHIVVVDVASVFASELVADTAVDGALPWFKVEETEEQERENLLTRGSKWPHGLQDHLPPELAEHVAKGRISLVGMEWLQASVAWGVFLDETPYTLDVICREQKHAPKSANRDGVVFSTTTPPLTPRRRTGFTDTTLLPFESSAKVIKSTGVSPSSQAGAGYQFDFTTPMATPVQPRQPRDVLHDGSVSVTRQSCPRSTLRTPRRQHIGLPRTLSPALALMNETVNLEVRGNSKDSVVEEGRETATPPRTSDMTTDHKACTPVRETCIVSSDDNGENNKNNKHNGGSDDDDDEVSSTRLSHLHLGSKNMPLAVAMPLQWDPDARSSTNSCQQPRPSASGLNLKNADSALSLQRPLVTPALRIHIVHDAPDRKELGEFCLRLSDSALDSSNHDNSCCSQADIDDSCAGPQEQYLQRPVNMAGVVMRVRLVGPSVRNADVLVTHQLTQRESVLAAIAAGLWVVTPKALQDCKTRQCLLPLHDLSVYEWSPELLPSGAPRSSLRLARQCRRCRQRRQASGVRLFDGKVFVIVSPDTSIGLSRARSMRNVLETGGGVVMWAAYNNSAPHTADEKAAKVQEQEREKTPPTRCSVGTTTQPTLVSSPEMLLDFIASKISGEEKEKNDDCINNDQSNHDAMGKCNVSSPKELVVLLEGHVQGETASEWLQDTIKVFRHAQTFLAEAKRKALERRQRSLHEQQLRLPPWGLAMGSSTDNPLHAAPHARFAPPQEDGERKRNDLTNGMPLLEAIRVFTSDWVTLAIQQLRATPLCALRLSS